ncbi:hypothetical protein AB0H83_08620 [Dactylosporangium sp. NPDC050688]|uniref:hypothetical protein n=1 Tax=Dactylosporangium sp. NPDC050688 TaxID=3157217 RepID=UPI0033D97A7B
MIDAAGVCGAAGFWINAGDRLLDFHAKVKAGESSTASFDDRVQLGGAIAFDRLSMRIPALRVTRNDPLTGRRPGQVRWRKKSRMSWASSSGTPSRRSGRRGRSPTSA